MIPALDSSWYGFWGCVGALAVQEGLVGVTPDHGMTDTCPGWEVFSGSSEAAGRSHPCGQPQTGPPSGQGQLALKTPGCTSGPVCGRSAL